MGCGCGKKHRDTSKVVTIPKKEPEVKEEEKKDEER